MKWMPFSTAGLKSHITAVYDEFVESLVAIS